MSADRRLRPGRLILAFLLAPLAAGALGGALLMGSSIALAGLSGNLDGPTGAVTAAMGAATLTAVVVGALVSAILASPLMILVWLIAHLFQIRSKTALAGVFSLSGAIFGALVFSLSETGPGPASAAAAGAGLIAGAGAGWLVGALGYADENGADAS